MSKNILAVSAGHEITEEEFNALVANYPAEQQVYLSSPDAKAQLLEQLIGYHLFAKMAEEKKIRESAEFKETLAKMEVELASHMAATSVINQVSVTDEEVKKFYDENQANFTQQPQVKAKHILVENEEMAKKVAAEINEGKSFEDAATEYSTCPSKDRGGDLGFFGKGQMVPEFEKVAFEAELGKMVGPVKTQFGYHLIVVEDKKEGSVMDFETVKTQLFDQVLNSKKQQVYAEKVKELEGKYGVERKNA